MNMAITLLVGMLLLRSMRATRGENLVVSISQKQVLEVGSSVELECNLENISDTAVCRALHLAKPSLQIASFFS